MHINECELFINWKYRLNRTSLFVQFYILCKNNYFDNNASNYNENNRNPEKVGEGGGTSQNVGTSDFYFTYNVFQFVAQTKFFASGAHSNDAQTSSIFGF